MHERKASGIAAEISQWILLCLGDPEQVHFHFDQIRVSVLQQSVIRHLALVCLKFEIVIVIGELDSRFLAVLGDPIECISDALPAVGCAHLLIDKWTHDITLPQRMRRLQGLGEVALNGLVGNVCGGRRQAVAIEHLSNVLRRIIKKAREFYLAVTDFSDLGKRTFKVLFHEIANGIELHPDFVQFVILSRPTHAAPENGGGSDGA